MKTMGYGEGGRGAQRSLSSASWKTQTRVSLLGGRGHARHAREHQERRRAHRVRERDVGVEPIAHHDGAGPTPVNHRVVPLTPSGVIAGLRSGGQGASHAYSAL